jgi:hypothetical protein
MTAGCNPPFAREPPARSDEHGDCLHNVDESTTYIHTYVHTDRV